MTNRTPNQHPTPPHRIFQRQKLWDIETQLNRFSEPHQDKGFPINVREIVGYGYGADNFVDIDTSLNGSLTVYDNDQVEVWVNGEVAEATTIPGAWKFYRTVAELDDLITDLKIFDEAEATWEEENK